MTKKLLVIASSLLFIVGCESELDKCMETNTGKFTIGGLLETNDQNREVFNRVIEHPVFVESLPEPDEDGDLDLSLADWRSAADAVTEELATEYCNAQGIY